MANATADRNTKEYASNIYQAQVVRNAAAATVYYSGTMQCDDGTGALRNPAVANAATDRVVLVVKDGVDNSAGAAADKKVEGKTGIFFFAKAGVNPPTAADAAKYATVFAIDNQTISRSAAAGPPAGHCVQVDTNGVWVAIGPQYVGAANAAA